MISATIFQFYAFGTIGHKFGKSYENDRLPNQIIATPGSDQPCSAANPDGYNTRFQHGEWPYRRLARGAVRARHRQRLQRRAGHAGRGPEPAHRHCDLVGQAGNLFSST